MYLDSGFIIDELDDNDKTKMLGELALTALARLPGKVGRSFGLLPDAVSLHFLLKIAKEYGEEMACAFTDGVFSLNGIYSNDLRKFYRNGWVYVLNSDNNGCERCAFKTQDMLDNDRYPQDPCPGADICRGRKSAISFYERCGKTWRSTGEGLPYWHSLKKPNTDKDANNA